MFFLGGISFAQMDRSGLTGTVTDPSGRLLAETHITAVQNSTQLQRETVSDSTGNYEISELPVGTYTVIFDHPAFQTLKFVDVKQMIGRTQTLDATLKVAGGEVRVEVSASSALMDRNTSAVTGLIERTQADELPLNGRDWSVLTAFVPGAIDTGGGNQRSVRFSGRGLDDSNFTYDGVDATNIVNQTQRPWVRLSIPLDAIQEFRVDSLMATAEEGATGGAQLNITSPSGTKTSHGRLFEYLRNDIFDAPLPRWGTPTVWTPSLATQPEAKQPLRLNQFGGSAGGPIVLDKTYFFLASEAYRQNWGYPASGDVPDPTYLANLANGINPKVSAIIKAFPGSGPKTTVTPISADADIVICQCTQVVNENSFMLRLDQHFSAKTTSFMRFNYDRSVNTQPLSATATDLQQKVSAPVNGVLELLHIFSSRLVNEAHAGFNRSTNNQYNNSDSGTIYKFTILGESEPGPAFATENYDYTSVYAGNSYSVNDDLTWTHDRHTVKAGVEYRHLQLNQRHPEDGSITFSSVANLAADAVKKASLTGALPVNELRKNDTIFYVQDEYKPRPNLTLNLGLHYTVFGLFSEKTGLAEPFDFDTCGPQGYCAVGSSFGQQNLGDIDPRVGFSWSPKISEKTVIHGGFGIYHEDGQLDDQNLPAGNEVPSYSASSSKSTLSYCPPATCPVQAAAVLTAAEVDAFTAGSYKPSAEQRDRKDTYVEQWSFSVQRELPASFVGTVSYLGSHGVHLLDTGETNLLAYDPATRTYGGASGTVTQYPLCAWNASAPAGSCATGIQWRGSVGMSTYNGLSLSLRRAFSHGLLVAANYMWSHEIDNGSNGSGDGDEIDPQNQACQSCETASGAWDARHVFNVNAVYELPFGHGKPLLKQGEIANNLAGGWELTTSAVARTGFPVNVLTLLNGPDGNQAGTQRPLLTGQPLYPSGGKTVAQWFNPAAFEIPAIDPITGNASVFGNAPRDLLRGPGTWQIDLSAGKTCSLRKRARLQFRAEFYNLFNHPQLGQPGATCEGNGSVTGPTPCESGTTFGQITSPINLNTSIVSPITPVGTGTPREVQLALRLEF
ncbi:MAG: carboxypeptidase-like regulatory domain-containing protein [Terracidiphilus sp.]